jgi:ATPase family associated with various cellular activities (AAA)
MTTATAHDWQTGNQAELASALARLKETLRRHAERGERPAAGENGTLATNREALPADRSRGGRDVDQPSALNALGSAFALSAFERDVVLLCAGIELDSAFAPLCAAAQGDSARSFPTFSLALAALSEAHWSALTPAAPLRRWRLIEVGAGSALTVAPLRIDERILHFLVGVPHLDDRLAALVQLLEAPAAEELAPSHAALARRVVAVWSAGRRQQAMPVIELSGPDAADCRAVAASAAHAVGLRLAVLPAELIPTGAELDALVRLWEREAALGGTMLLVEGAEPAADGPRAHAVERLIERLVGPMLVSDRERRKVAHRPLVSFDVDRPTPAEQRAAWHAVLGPALEASVPAVDLVASQFSLSLPAIRAAAAETLARTAASADADIANTTWDVCRTHARTRLEDLAQRIEPAASWNDLVLPAAQAEAVRRIAVHVRHRTTVHDAWGFAAKSGRSLGISVLFAGASGTGKTMAAEVLANELHLDLYRIDLACVVSKYIGETEKNLRRVFDAAETGAAILLFDEADALFGKRSEVKDSHDRYANIEVSYLLQRMEAYRGLAILTTNLKSALDSAFLRRLRFVIEFPFPDAAERAEIWRRIFPPATPTERLDFTKLAKLNVPGGNIRNIALNAAFLAAEAGTPIRMNHLRDAARAEYLKLERPLTEAEIGGWV